MEKIAVHCPTEKLYFDVLKKRGLSKWKEYYHLHEKEICVSLGIDVIQTRKYYREDVYTIIPASEYLKGGNEVEFKVGDRVEVTRAYDDAKKGMVGTIKGPKNAYDEFPVEFNKEFDGGHNCSGICEPTKGHWIESKKLKLINKQIKEEVMNVNSTVAKVFKDVDEAILVTQFMGTEYPEGNHRAFLTLKQYKKEVLAEAKRLEKEEKDSEK